MHFEQRLKNKIDVQGLSRSTFKTYRYWCRSFFRYCKSNGIGRETKAEEAAERWLTHLAQSEQLANNSQSLALQSICYLYREVFGRPLEGVSAIRAKRSQTVPVVPSVQEVARLFAELDGVGLLASQFMYGCGLRISEVASLRIKDLDFDRGQLHIHAAKGDKSRHTSFPAVMHDSVRSQIESARVVFETDKSINPNGSSIPGGLAIKYAQAATSFSWMFLFPSENLSRLDDGPLCRHHIHTGTISRQIKDARERAGILKPITAHKLRHGFATHSNETGTDVTVLQQLMGHTDIRTTMIYVHANKGQATSARSPLEGLLSCDPEVKKNYAKPEKVETFKPRIWRAS